MSPEFSAADSFLHLDVKDPDGKPISDPEELTPALVTFLHGEVSQVYDYTVESLEALDQYFTAEPPEDSFKAQFLFEEFIPALGAYLGEVLRRQLGGTWIRKSPVLTSTVRVGDREFKVFAEAFDVVYSGKRLADVYRSALASSKG